MAQAEDKRIFKVVLSLGSNLKDRKLSLKKAKSLINTKIGNIALESNTYETEAWGEAELNSFLNEIVIIETNLSASLVLTKCLQIENELGRIRPIREKQIGIYENRCIDIDVIYYDSSIINSENLTVPHPNLHLRMFILKPLNEIAPNWVHPILNKSTQQLIKDCNDKNEVKLYYN